MTKAEFNSFIWNNKQIYFNRFRYFFFEWTSMQPYEKILVTEMVVGFIYQIILFLVSAAGSAIFIYNNAQYHTYSAERTSFIINYYNFFYGFNFVFLLDFLMRWMYADYTYSHYSRKKAFLLMPFKFVNALDLTSIVIVITIYNVVVANELAAIEQATTISQKQAAFERLVFDKVAINVFPAFLLARILGLHQKIIKHTIASNDVNFFVEIIKRRWNVLLSSLILLILMTFFLSFIVYRAEQDFYNTYNIPVTDDRHKFKDFGSAMWFAVGTITTIAYGDITPVSHAGRVFGALLGLGGVGYFGFVTSLFASGIVSIIAEKARNRENTRLKVLHSENERLLEEFSVKIKEELLEELIKHNTSLNEEVEVQEIKVDKTDLLDIEKTRKGSNTRLKKALFDETNITSNKRIIYNSNNKLKKSTKTTSKKRER